MRGQRLLTTLLLVASVAILAPVAGAKSDLGARTSGAGKTQHEQALRAALASLAAHSTKQTGVIGRAGHLGLAPAELAAIQAKQGVEATGRGAGWRDTGIGASNRDVR
jgi:hypothetical protein